MHEESALRYTWRMIPAEPYTAPWPFMPCQRQGRGLERMVFMRDVVAVSIRERRSLLTVSSSVEEDDEDKEEVDEDPKWDLSTLSRYRYPALP